jgi:anaerobic ribonucleoside-triphosphate reductase activating protein
VVIAEYGVSFLDFEGKTALLIFTQGCDYDCWFCFSSRLKKKIRKLTNIPEVIEHLRGKLNYYEAVVVTGGEPTIWGDRLVGFLETINSYGLPIKLDTCGSNPKVLEKLLDRGLLTVVAMDIKHDLFNFERMAETIGIPYRSREWQALMDSMTFLSRYSNVQKIYRTTVIPTLNEVHFIKILRTLERFWDDNSTFHVQRYDHAAAHIPIFGDEPDLESYEKILNSFGFKYRFKNF